MTVTPNGYVLPCPAAAAIRDASISRTCASAALGEIWRDSDAFGRYRGTGWMPEPCRSCDRREIDWGGCRCQAFLLTGDAGVTDPACSLSPDHPHRRCTARSAPRTSNRSLAARDRPRARFGRRRRRAAMELRVRELPAARAGRAPRRTQSSLAVSADGERWLLLNCSPDVARANRSLRRRCIPSNRAARRSPACSSPMRTSIIWAALRCCAKRGSAGFLRALERRGSRDRNVAAGLRSVRAAPASLARGSARRSLRAAERRRISSGTA